MLLVLDGALLPSGDSISLFILESSLGEPTASRAFGRTVVGLGLTMYRGYLHTKSAKQGIS